MVPEQCVERYEPLRQLLLPNRNTSSITYEYVTGNDGPAYDEVLELEWWEEEFLPLVASAFSCGYTSADDDNTNPRFLPGDIRDASPNSITIRQVWRFVKGYIRPPQNNEKELIVNRISTYPCMCLSYHQNMFNQPVSI